MHDTEIEAVGLVAVKAAEGVAAVAVYLGFSSLLDFLIGPVDVSGINTRLDVNEYYINSLSTNSALSINKLNTIRLYKWFYSFFIVENYEFKCVWIYNIK